MVQPCRYALVAYVNNSVGQFVEQLRRDLHPSLPHMAAHLTVLPPRCLVGTEDEARRSLENVCREIEPFEVSLDEVETFIPVTPTVFIRVGCEARQLRDLHDRLTFVREEAKNHWVDLAGVPLGSSLVSKNSR